MARASFTSIFPKAYKKGTFRLALLNEMRKVGREITQDFLRPTKTWEDKVVFKQSPTLAGDVIGVTVSTDNPLYLMVSGGTEGAHNPIVPVDAQALAFPAIYNPKTQPGSLDAAQGGAEGLVIVKVVKDPKGIRARHFEQVVEDLWRPKIQERFQRAIEEAAERTGYAL